MNKFTVMSKAVGTIATGIMLYDAGSAAVHESSREQIRCTSNRLPDQYVNSMRMNKMSATGNELKKGFFRWQLDQGFSEFFAGIGGAIKGFAGNLMENVIPLSLATGALLFKKAGRFCGLGLVAYGAKYLISDVMNVGKPKLLGDDL